MKIKHLFSVALVLCISTFTSCDLFDKADDVNFDVDVPLNFVVNISEVLTFSDEALLNAKTNSDVAKYASKIESFKVNKITYSIEGSNASSQTFSGSLVIAEGGQTLGTLTNVAVTNTLETDLPVNVDGLNALASKLLDDKEELVRVAGLFSDGSVNFTLKLRFYLTIKANAL
ncbi:MAG: hypothetical protein KF775_05855 [Cyclobacteriaceae bacterium]|nr:hypothetical protein [Cyclobacteriaceae bacterium]